MSTDFYIGAGAQKVYSRARLHYNIAMRIGKVTLTDFRNYASQTVTLDDGLNVFEGENASGKTNFAESLYCCALGKSPRTQNDKEMIRWGADRACVVVEVIKQYRSYEVRLLIDSKGKKRLAIDGIPAYKMSEILGILNIVYFSPDELRLIKDGPAERRRFMDISLCQQSKNYVYNLQKYNAALAQRNKLLKSKLGYESLKQTLFVWDTQLAKHGAYVTRKRYEFAQKLKTYAKKAHSMLSDSKEQLDISLESALEYDDIEAVAEQYRDCLQANVQKDIDLSFTSFGCHRDDLKITLNDIDVRKFGSQGQQRSAALSLKFAEIDLFDGEVGERPVLILDDVLSELDERRSARLLEMSSDLQTVITCTRFDESIPHSSFRVINGNIAKM